MTKPVTCVRRMKSEDGSAFLFAIIALVVLLTVGAASLQIAMQSLDRAKHNEYSAASFNLAEAAADMAEAWLRAQPAPPSTTDPFDPLGGTVTDPTGSMSAIIYPSAGNPGTWQKTYTIEGIGQAARDSHPRRVIMKVQEQSFALYAYFTDQERSSVSNGTIWFYARDRIEGPVHTNDTLHISWDSTSADPIFRDTISSHANNVDWSPRAPRNPNEWRRVAQGGQDALTLGADYIPLPDSTERQRNAAWGDDWNFPTDEGVNVPHAGSTLTAGIFVSGDCEMEFDVDPSTGCQLIDIVQGSDTTEFTVDLENNTTTVLYPGDEDPTIYTGLPNGVIYCTGDIDSLEGTVADNYENGSTILRRNAWTIATDVSAGKDVTLTDNLQYQTPPDSTKPETHPSNLRAPAVGIVAEDVIVHRDCPNEMTIDAVILAGGENTTNGTFYYAGWQDYKRNNLHILGGIIQKKRGPIGTFNPYNNVHVSGYNKDYHYDPRMADSPPPYFPTTGEYDVKSWQEK